MRSSNPTAAAAPADTTNFTTFGNPSGYGSAYNATGPVVGSFVAGPSGPASVNVQEAETFQNVVVRIPHAEIAQVVQGPPTIKRRVIPGPVIPRVVPDVIPGPVRTVKQFVPGQIIYKDEKVEVPGPVRERIERVEVPGPVIERVVKEYVPGPVVEKEVKVEIPGPVTYKDVKVEVPGPVIRRPVPQQVQVPGPVRVVQQRVPVPQYHIREVEVERKVAVPKPMQTKAPSMTRHVYVRKTDNLLMAENARLRQEIAYLNSLPFATTEEDNIIAERQQQAQFQYPGAAPAPYGSAYPGYGF
ncbi:uncharacterized protein AMSG_01036 [Thecamonas trahens ATCC 50062]|uniref:Uncharacterized protein n=1 Tax=Thecamonas trahens ATCC 50062 TaxID=461836 RepID=A0A0L0DLE0_THETB|nr:hypothetical protein AMSG_01036 [Thecamonas trahens ATCC 50062]KNC52208.1 hypothetical protein AMSG_01036 [Thecamonas trahens ATCC 50062]|eukprot:XP_013762211.1 hypothetical protein AMSG_01036 [Thecamonas trahens ATCC 50062]